MFLRQHLVFRPSVSVRTTQKKKKKTAMGVKRETTEGGTYSQDGQSLTNSPSYVQMNENEYIIAISMTISPGTVRPSE